MTNKLNQHAWLVEFDIPTGGGEGSVSGPPLTQPGMPQDPMGTGNQIEDPQQGGPVDVATDDMADISDDPEHPDMPEQKEEDDFETWKIKYMNESIKGDAPKLKSMIEEMRDLDLDPIDQKFLEDNLQVNLLRLNSNIRLASNEIRSRIKKDLDRTNPAASLIGHIAEVLDQSPLMNEVYIKISGMG